MKGKKAGFDFQTYLIGLVLICGIIVSLSMFYKDMADNYSIDSTSTQNFSDSYNHITELSAATGQLQNSSETTNLGTAGGYSTFYGSAIGTLKIIQNLYSIPKSILNGIAASIPIPPIWITIAGVILIILIVTTLLFMIFQSKGN